MASHESVCRLSKGGSWLMEIALGVLIDMDSQNTLTSLLSRDL